MPTNVSQWNLIIPCVQQSRLPHTDPQDLSPEERNFVHHKLQQPLPNLCYIHYTTVNYGQARLKVTPMFKRFKKYLTTGREKTLYASTKRFCWIIFSSECSTELQMCCCGCCCCCCCYCCCYCCCCCCCCCSALLCSALLSFYLKKLGSYVTCVLSTVFTVVGLNTVHMERFQSPE